MVARVALPRRHERFEQFMQESARQRAADREEVARERREANRKWGEASDRIGRFVENIVAPWWENTRRSCANICASAGDGSG